MRVKTYRIYKSPKSPTENGEYYAQAPILEQALNVVRRNREEGYDMFLKVLWEDGTETYYDEEKVKDITEEVLNGLEL